MCKTAVTKAGKRQTEKADKLREVGEAHEEPLFEAIKDAFRVVKDNIVLATLTAAIADGDQDEALAASKVEMLEEELAGPLTAGTVAALIAGADEARGQLPPAVRAGGAFDSLDDAVQSWIRRNGGRQITQIAGGSRRAINAIISDMIETGMSPSRAAKLIREHIGLSATQAKALQRQAAALAAEGATQAVIDRTIKARAARMLDERAFAIARNESFTAVAQGQQLYWNQLVDRGALDPETQRKWITAEDERVCPICRPMHNQIRGINEPFSKGPILGGSGTVVTAPSHVTCRCSVILVNPKRPPEDE